MNLDRIQVIRIKGNLTKDKLARLRFNYTEITEKTRPRGLVLALEEVNQVDAGGLHFLTWVTTQMHEAGGRVCLAAARPKVNEALRASGLLCLMPLARTEQQALDYLASSQKSA